MSKVVLSSKFYKYCINMTILLFLKGTQILIFFCYDDYPESPSVFLCQSFCLLLSLFSGWVCLFWPPCSIPTNNFNFIHKMSAHAFPYRPDQFVRAVLVFAMSGSFSPCKILMKNHAIPSKIIVAIEVNKLLNQNFDAFNITFE